MYNNGSIFQVRASFYLKISTLQSRERTFSHCHSPLTAPTPNQDAIAQCLVRAREPYEGFDSYYKWLVEEYRRKRDLLVAALKAGGMSPILPDGGFFIMADTTGLEVPAEYLAEKTVAMPADPMPRDWAMSRWMTKEAGVTAIPPSAFYEEKNIALASNLLRFAYCKGDKTIAEAGERFQKFFGS